MSTIAWNVPRERVDVSSFPSLLGFLPPSGYTACGDRSCASILSLRRQNEMSMELSDDWFLDWNGRHEPPLDGGAASEDSDSFTPEHAALGLACQLRVIQASHNA